MSEPLKDSVALLQSVLGHIGTIAGEDAFGALLHYGAVQEGRRLVRDAGSTELEAVFAHLDAIVGQRSRLLESTHGNVRIHVIDSPLLGGDGATRQVLSGLVAGIVGAVSNTEQEATFIESPEDGFRGAVLETHARARTPEVTA